VSEESLTRAGEAIIFAERRKEAKIEVRE